MAQTQTITNEGIGELVKLMCGEAATCVKSICCLTDTTPCTASVTSTYASPASNKIVDSGLSIVDADSVVSSTTNTTDDTIELNHAFTASGTKNVSGVIICNDDNDVNIGECCFNAVLALESSDMLAVEFKVVVDQA